MQQQPRKYAKRGRPRKLKKGSAEADAEAEEFMNESRERNNRKVQLETFRRTLGKIPGEGNYNDPRLFGGIDWSTISFTHPAYEHIKRKHLYNPELVVPKHKIIHPHLKRQRTSSSSSSSSLSSSSSSSSSSSTTTTPILVQLTPSLRETRHVHEQLEVEYLSSGGLGDLKHSHLLIRRYIAENSPAEIMEHADRVAKKAVSLVLKAFTSTAGMTEDNAFNSHGRHGSTTNGQGKTTEDFDEDEEDDADTEALNVMKAKFALKPSVYNRRSEEEESHSKKKGADDESGVVGGEVYDL